MSLFQGHVKASLWLLQLLSYPQPVLGVWSAEAQSLITQLWTDSIGSQGFTEAAQRSAVPADLMKLILPQEWTSEGFWTYIH